MIHRKKGKTSAESVPQGRGYRGTLFFADLVPFFRNILKAILFEHKEHGKWSGSVLATSGRDAVPANGVQEAGGSNPLTQTTNKAAWIQSKLLFNAVSALKSLKTGTFEVKLRF